MPKTILYKIFRIGAIPSKSDPFWSQSKFLLLMKVSADGTSLKNSGPRGDGISIARKDSRDGWQSRKNGSSAIHTGNARLIWLLMIRKYANSMCVSRIMKPFRYHLSLHFSTRTGKVLSNCGSKPKTPVIFWINSQPSAFGKVRRKIVASRIIEIRDLIKN